MSTLRAELKLLAVPTAVACAREFTTQMLQRWRLADLVDTACLVVSELTTNAVKSTGTSEPEPDDATLASLPTVELRLSIRSGVLLIEVQDTSTTPPELQQQYEGMEGGRGLFLVAMLSKEWSFYLPERRGKVVWAAVELLSNGEQNGMEESEEDGESGEAAGGRVYDRASGMGRAAGPLPRRMPGVALAGVWEGRKKAADTIARH